MNAVKANTLSRELEEKGLLEGMILQPRPVTNVNKRKSCSVAYYAMPCYFKVLCALLLSFTEVLVNPPQFFFFLLLLSRMYFYLPKQKILERKPLLAQR